MSTSDVGMTRTGPVLEQGAKNPTQQCRLRPESCPNLPPTAVHCGRGHPLGGIGPRAHLWLVRNDYRMTIDTGLTPGALGGSAQRAGGCASLDQHMCSQLTLWVSSDGVEDTELAAIEKELCRLPAVNAARIVTDDIGRPKELHILAGAEKSPKQIARD